MKGVKDPNAKYIDDDVDEDTEEDPEEKLSLYSAMSAQSAPYPGRGKKVKKKTHRQPPPQQQQQQAQPQFLGTPVTNNHNEDSESTAENISGASYDSLTLSTQHIEVKKKSGAEGAYAALNKKERREFLAAFRAFDRNEEGQISVYNLQEVFKGLNYHFTVDDCIEMLKSIDTDRNGKVDIDEFVYAMKIGNKYSDTSRPFIDELKEAFEVFDKDGNGEISSQELSSIMKALGEDFKEEEIFYMMKEADQDDNGAIDFEEFKQLMHNDSILFADEDGGDKQLDK
eukprot:CAMPEP_0202727612 /NCGR_PEP_ID=MMETSP1385-20130828/185211_1 /ASSEMBLY_ACC=CAM_ASM_000861 /TAXON_ID=933848 /ORGANISM="Elphidium margaritaceum" /LENGTH=283 /DNA_ID=CAMNT_0049393855 /DNA_START=38 /DNA_END=889 /DNA_ORIENTATION=-